MSPPQALIPWCVDKRRSSLPGRYLSSHRDMWYPLTVHSWHNHQLSTMRSEIFPDVGADTAELFSVLLPSILTPSQSVTTWTGESNWNEIKQARSPSRGVAPATYPIILIELILDHYYFYCHWTLLFFLLRVLVFLLIHQIIFDTLKIVQPPPVWQSPPHNEHRLWEVALFEPEASCWNLCQACILQRVCTQL